MANDPFVKGGVEFARFYQENLVQLTSSVGGDLIAYACLKGKKSLLEVGNGTGALSKMIYDAKDEDAVLVCGDPSISMRTVAADLFKAHNVDTSKLTHLELDAQALNFPDAHFDAYFATYIMCHVPDSHKMIQEAMRVLKPKGVLLLADWDNDTKHDLFVLLGKVYPKEQQQHSEEKGSEEKKEGHQHGSGMHEGAKLVATPDFMKNALKEAGFERVFSWRREVFLDSYNEVDLAHKIESMAKIFIPERFPKEEEERRIKFELLLNLIREKLDSGRLLGNTAVLTVAVKKQ